MASDYQRKIIGDIDEEAFKEFMDYEPARAANMDLMLTSHGGDAMTALAFYDWITRHKGEVTIEVYGVVASAAVLILAAGDHRRMHENAWVMVHEDTVAVSEDDRVSVIERKAKDARKLEDQWNKLLEGRTNMSSKFWETLHKEETWLSAEECLQYGLIDEIIGG